MAKTQLRHLRVMQTHTHPQRWILSPRKAANSFCNSFLSLHIFDVFYWLFIDISRSKLAWKFEKATFQHCNIHLYMSRRIRLPCFIYFFKSQASSFFLRFFHRNYAGGSIHREGQPIETCSGGCLDVKWGIFIPPLSKNILSKKSASSWWVMYCSQRKNVIIAKIWTGSDAFRKSSDFLDGPCV